MCSAARFLVRIDVALLLAYPHQGDAILSLEQPKKGRKPTPTRNPAAADGKATAKPTSTPKQRTLKKMVDPRADDENVSAASPPKPEAKKKKSATKTSNNIVGKGETEPASPMKSQEKGKGKGKGKGKASSNDGDGGDDDDTASAKKVRVLGVMLLRLFGAPCRVGVSHRAIAHRVRLALPLFAQGHGPHKAVVADAKPAKKGGLFSGWGRKNKGKGKATKETEGATGAGPAEEAEGIGDDGEAGAAVEPVAPVPGASSDGGGGKPKRKNKSKKIPQKPDTEATVSFADDQPAKESLEESDAAAEISAASPDGEGAAATSLTESGADVARGPKKKKKKKKKPAAEAVVSTPSLPDGADADADADADATVAEENETTAKPKKKSKKSKRRERTQRQAAQMPKSHIEVTIHRTDKLKLTKKLTAPVVMVSFLDMDSGQIVHGHDDDGSTSAGPVGVTKPYDFRTCRSLSPSWEHAISVEVDYDEMVDGRNVVAIFELSGRPASSGQSGWGQGFDNLPVVCWCFLKLNGATGRNTEQQARLQLYEYSPASKRTSKPAKKQTRKARDDDETDGENTQSANPHQWNNRLQAILDATPRRPYPSTMYISIHPKVARARKKKDAVVTDSDVDGSGDELLMGLCRLPKPMWQRLPGQKCLVPDQPQRHISHEQGCYTLSFSNDGERLAAAAADHQHFPIIIYHVFDSATASNMIDEDPAVLLKLDGHMNLVQDMHWSADDTRLITASSDGTARLWSTTGAEHDPQIKILPHPCFVYCARLFVHGDAPSELMAFTGAYDGVIRQWDLFSEGPTGVVITELHHHSHHVNSLALDGHAMKLFSGDAHGILTVWIRKGTDWDVHQTIEHDEIIGHPVNRLQMHPSGRRLLVHVRDNIIRMLDLRTNSFMQRFHGCTNQRTSVRGSISGCGGFVVGGSEDGTAHMWNADNGQMVHHFSDLAITTPVHEACFHPHDHLVAFCSFGAAQPILVYRAQKVMAEAMRAARLMATRAAAGGATTGDTAIAASPFLRSPMPSSLPALNATSASNRGSRNTLGLPQVRTPRASLSKLGYGQSGRSGPLNLSDDFNPSSPGGMSLPGAIGFQDDAAGLIGLHEQRQMHVETILNQATSVLAQRKASLTAEAQTPVPLFTKGGGSSAPGTPAKTRTSGGLQDDSMSETQEMAELLQKKLKMGKTPKKTPKKKSVKELDVPELYRSTHSYKAMRGDELSFQAGDIVEVVAKASSMWWRAKFGGDVGLVPANFLTLVTPKDVVTNVPCTSAGTPQSPVTSTPIKGRGADLSADTSATEVDNGTPGATTDTSTVASTSRTQSQTGSALRASRRARRARALKLESTEGAGSDSKA